jgi:hypothetical protein
MVATGMNSQELGPLSGTMAVTGMSSQHLDLALRVAKVGSSDQLLCEKIGYANMPEQDIHFQEWMN